MGPHGGHVGGGCGGHTNGHDDHGHKHDHDDHEHDHDGHDAAHPENVAATQRMVRRKLMLATVFALAFMGVEIAGGIIAGSLAIVTDAAHLFTDIANFISAILASHLAEQGPSNKLSYGLVRAEVLSALINTGVIVLLAGYLVYEGIRRSMSWFNGTAAPIDGKLMMIIACVGVVFNIALMAIFGHEHGHGHDHGHSHGGHSHNHGEYQALEEGHSHGEEGHKHDDHDHDHHDHDHDHDDHDHDEHDHGKDDHCCPKKGEGVKLLENAAVGPAPVATYGSLQEGALVTHKKHDHGSHAHGPHDEGSSGKKKKRKAKKNINLEAAHLHVITDLVQSIGVAIAGVIVYLRPDWQIVDPIVTILFSIVIVFSTLKMLSKSTHVLLEGVPDGIDPEFLKAKLERIPGVTDVHDLHIWNLSIDRPLVTVHLKASDPDPAMLEAHKIFARAGITHVTVQIQKDLCEPGTDCAHPCPSRACKVGGQCA